ncbi:MAG TPA: Fur family transcriptional regulator [Anaerolineae bacterium]
MLDLDSVTQQLSERQFKITRQRRAVLRAIAGSNSRMSPAEVYAQARRNCRDLGLATVYRTLDILVEIGAIRRMHLDDGCEGFAPASAEHGHHLICSECHATIEFEDCNMTAMLKRLESRTGFTIEKHWLELVGRCPECQGKR